MPVRHSSCQAIAVYCSLTVCKSSHIFKSRFTALGDLAGHSLTLKTAQAWLPGAVKALL